MVCLPSPEKHTSQLFHLIAHLLSNFPTLKEFLTFNYISQNIFLNFTLVEFLIAIGLIIFMEIIHYFQRGKSIRQLVSTYPTAVRWSLYYLFVMAFFVLGVFDKPAQFIYFQF